MGECPVGTGELAHRFIGGLDWKVFKGGNPMERQLVLELPEAIYEQLQTVSTITRQSPEDWVKKLLFVQLPKTQLESEKKATMGRVRRHFGAVDLGHPTGVDNEQIDADLAKAYAATHEEK